MIDLTKSYRVYHNPSGESDGLGKYGLAMAPGTFRTFTISYNDDTKRYKTGLDEYAPEVQTLPKDEKLEKVAWIKKTREELEQEIGSPNILSATNDDFWSVYRIVVEVGFDKKLKVLNSSHPFFDPQAGWNHRLALITLRANGEMPFSRKEAEEPKYRRSPFFIATEEDETILAKENIKKERQRASEMYKLFPEDGEGEVLFDRAFNIAYILGIIKDNNIGRIKLEEALEIYTKQKDYMDNFLKLCKMTDEELATRTTIFKAINYDIIKFRAVKGEEGYYRGAMNFRETKDDTIKFILTNLASPQMAGEFVEIKAAIGKMEQATKGKKK